MQRLVLLSTALLSLAACQPSVPDSAQGVGFESYSDYMRRRDGQLGGQGAALTPMAGGPAISSEVVSTAPLDGPMTGTTPAQGVQQGALIGGALDANRPRGNAPTNIRIEDGEVRHSGAGLSDEQNFDAVASRESIASDAERRRAQQAQYVQIAPTALPDRTAASGPNIVQFALATNHMPGTKMYGRSSFRLKSYESACAPFTSADLAQEEFLRRGGPERDALGVDPDGDGFACGWDPRPFRIK